MTVIEWQSRWMRGKGAVMMLHQSGSIETLDTLMGSVRFREEQRQEVAGYLEKVVKFLRDEEQGAMEIG